jgi:hypothetical protein
MDPACEFTFEPKQGAAGYAYAGLDFFRSLLERKLSGITVELIRCVKRFPN